MARLQFLALGAALFINGFVLMALELVGARIVAPFLGTTVEVWTGIIAVILGALGLGYVLGGKLADRGGSPKIFSLIVFGAALLTLAIARLRVLVAVAAQALPYPLAALASALLLFFLPALLLASATLYAIRSITRSLETAGRTSGRLYGTSTFGNLAGIFGTGWFLVPKLGTTGILYFLAALLFLSSIVVLVSNPSR